MPIYEYRCSSCGHELEALQKFSDAPLTACPACSKDSLVKLVSAAGFQLKGTGWYATDFKGASGSKSAAKSEPATKPAEGKAEAKSDSASSGAAPATSSSPAPASGSGSTTS